MFLNTAIQNIHAHYCNRLIQIGRNNNEYHSNVDYGIDEDDSNTEDNNDIETSNGTPKEHTDREHDQRPYRSSVEESQNNNDDSDSQTITGKDARDIKHRNPAKRDASRGLNEDESTHNVARL